MSITDFYTNTLGANLAGVRWSWGATNPNTNQIFLRVWEDELESVGGVERSLLLKHDWPGKSNGFPERKRHIEAMRNGAEGYGVVCTAKDTTAAGRKIAHFDESTLLRFGEVLDEGQAVYGIVVGRVEVEDLARPRSAIASLVPDMKAILSRRLETTEKETFANARVGQGLFRAQVLAMWESRCCVTGTATLDAVRASHIKPWRDSTDEERLNPHNGLPLVATLDALFDAGLISFADDGGLLISPVLKRKEAELLGLDGLMMSRNPSDESAFFLRHHREHIFRG